VVAHDSTVPAVLLICVSHNLVIVGVLVHDVVKESSHRQRGAGARNRVLGRAADIASPQILNVPKFYEMATGEVLVQTP